MSRARLALVEPPRAPAEDPPPQIPFPVGAVVEITSGLSKGSRGVVLGPARSTYRGVADVEVRLETGEDRWIRPDFLKVIS